MYINVHTVELKHLQSFRLYKINFHINNKIDKIYVCFNGITMKDVVKICKRRRRLYQRVLIAASSNKFYLLLCYFINYSLKIILFIFGTLQNGRYCQKSHCVLKTRKICLKIGLLINLTTQMSNLPKQLIFSFISIKRSY